MEYIKEKKVAIEAATAAFRICQKLQKSLQKEDILIKEDASLVTLADYCSQITINSVIHDYFPQDFIMGEETSVLFERDRNQPFLHKILYSLAEFNLNYDQKKAIEMLEKSEFQGDPKKRFWAIDPIDGTKGFIRHEQYAIAISLIENGKVKLGVLVCPDLKDNGHKGVSLIAIRNQGCYGYNILFENERKLHVSSTISNAVYCEPHHQSQSHSHSKTRQIALTLNANLQPFQLDSQCKYALVALAQAEFYLRIPSNTNLLNKEKIWDHAAGSIIVEESGGIVTDIFDKPLDFTLGNSLVNNIGIVATNKAIHNKVIACIKQM